MNANRNEREAREQAMADLDRGEIIGMLERLGAAEDQEVLTAARSLHARVSEAGVKWDDLLRGPASDGDDAEDEVEEAEEAEEAEEIKESPPVAAAPLPNEKAEDAKIIDQILARKGLSKEMRQSLAELKRGLGDGSTDAADRRYIRALAKRLNA
jgi:hypothetical protein